MNHIGDADRDTHSKGPKNSTDPSEANNKRRPDNETTKGWLCRLKSLLSPQKSVRNSADVSGQLTRPT